MNLLYCAVTEKKFDERDPLEMLWGLSRKVVIFNTDWVEYITDLLQKMSIIRNATADKLEMEDKAIF